MSGQPIDPNSSKILGLVSQAGTLNSDPNPTDITWVYASRGAIAKTMDFGIPDDEAQHQQVLIVAHGNFTSTTARVPAGATAPTGNVMELVYDTTTWESTDFGLATSAPDLTPLGQIYKSNG
ncbi:hypothetical protein SAMN05892883_1517 [Jatrophihabitans sp. GAS493]|uniref:hypothetical protein n=1 Tax=Jatrophihabitans sp. GAS493 TaxID=1907575 RepID=UPI000BBFD447|nr:hypothetical protein [Jatrophihabitans sp. GAS493]SOD72080.1 hypothetical protein SAMN05892883_1517 [Jatrophihabitans sp. GAS493]